MEPIYEIDLVQRSEDERAEKLKRLRDAFPGRTFRVHGGVFFQELVGRTWWGGKVWRNLDMPETNRAIQAEREKAAGPRFCHAEGCVEDPIVTTRLFHKPMWWAFCAKHYAEGFPVVASFLDEAAKRKAARGD